MTEGNIFTEKGERRIFEGELVEARAGHSRVRGFHLQDPATMQARGIVVDELTRNAADSRVVYLVSVMKQGAKRKAAYNGMFPVGWTRDQVKAAIAEAYAARSPRSVGWVDPGGFYKGRTRTGMLIMLELDEGGRVIDAFPVRAKNPNNRRRDARYRVERGVVKNHREVCGQCHALKVRVCPNGHNTPFEGLRWYYWLRSAVRRIVREL